MVELPPRFTADLENALTGPSAPSSEQESAGTIAVRTSHDRPRQWDDPPETSPPPSRPGESTATLATMIFKRAFSLPAHLESEITQLFFSPGGGYITATCPATPSTRHLVHPAGPLTLSTWSATTRQRLYHPSDTASSAMSDSQFFSGPGIRLNGSLAFHPAPPAGRGPVVACPLLHAKPVSTYDYLPALMGRIEVYDLGRRERLLEWKHCPLQAPLAWGNSSSSSSSSGSSGSGGGEWLAGVSLRDPRHVLVVAVDADLVTNAAPAVRPRGKAKEKRKVSGMGKEAGSVVRVEKVLVGHEDEVTHLAFLPPSPATAGTTALVSVGKDGLVRVTCVETGRTLKKIGVGGRAPARILQVSPDGSLVVTVWGRDVVLWYLDSGRVHSYNLDAVRRIEGWPLCVSPDCRYLACRTEDGFDVSDLPTGRFRGECGYAGPPITAAAFNPSSTLLAVGIYSGEVGVFSTITG